MMNNSIERNFKEIENMTDEDVARKFKERDIKRWKIE